MKFLDWSKDFEIGIGAIDTDHQMLFDTIKQLGEHIAQAQTPGRITATIQSLLLYVDEHFDREERFLRRAGYPDFVAHKLEHDRFRDTILSLNEYHSQNPDLVDGQKVVTFLEDWLLNHIVKVDKAYAPYLLGDINGDPELQKILMDNQPGQTVQIPCPSDKKAHVEHFIKLISEGSEEGGLIEDAVEKITILQKTRREKQAKKYFGR